MNVKHTGCLRANTDDFQHFARTVIGIETARSSSRCDALHLAVNAHGAVLAVRGSRGSGRRGRRSGLRGAQRQLGQSRSVEEVLFRNQNLDRRRKTE